MDPADDDKLLLLLLMLADWFGSWWSFGALIIEVIEVLRDLQAPVTFDGQ